jgi:hypothetical protein
MRPATGSSPAWMDRRPQPYGGPRNTVVASRRPSDVELRRQSNDSLSGFGKAEPAQLSLPYRQERQIENVVAHRP